MKHFIDNFKNSFDFYLRNKLNFSLKNYYEVPDDINKILSDAKLISLYNLLKGNYKLDLLKDSTRRIFLENIYFLNIFDKYLSKQGKQNIRFLDIGSKNWSYIKSEYIFCKLLSNEFYLNGIELDAYRLCSNLYNRYEIAKFYAKNLTNTNYIVGDFMEHQEKYDFIVWILPFITEYPLIKWGLPMKYFQPEKMLRHAYDLLNDGGELLIINQGEEEYSIQQNLNQKLNLSATYLGKLEDKLLLFKNKRFGCKIVK